MYYFARLQPDGRLGMPLPMRYETIEAAKVDAITKLLHLKRGAGQIVLIKIVESAEVTAKVDYTPWPPKKK